MGTTSTILAAERSIDENGEQSVISYGDVYRDNNNEEEKDFVVIATVAVLSADVDADSY